MCGFHVRTQAEVAALTRLKAQQKSKRVQLLQLLAQQLIGVYVESVVATSNEWPTCPPEEH